MERIALNTVICLAIGLGSVVALADEPVPVNQISTVEVAEQTDGTAITITGSSSPTFSVYRLENPARLFIDFSNTEIAGEVTNWSVRNGLVDEVLVLQYQDDRSLVTRIVVSLQNEAAEYDIVTAGTNVVATILGDRLEQPGGPVDAQEYARMVQAREAEIATLRQAAQQAQEEARVAQAAALNAEAERQMAALQAFQLEQERQALDAENSELRRRTAQAEARAQEVLAEYEEALRSLQGYQEEVANQRQNLDTLNDQTIRWQQEVTELRGELSVTRGELQQRDTAIREAMAREEELRQAVQQHAEDQAGDDVDLERMTQEQQQLRQQLAALRTEYQDLVDQASATNESLTAAETNLSRASDRRSAAEAQAVQSQQRMAEIQLYVQRLEQEVADSEREAQAQDQQVRELEANLADMAIQEQQHRQRAEQVAVQLAQTEQELEQARSNEIQMHQEIERLESRSRDLDQQIDELEQMAGQRDLLAEELSQNERERQALQVELEQIRAQLAEADDRAARAIQLRQQSERNATEAEQESRRSEARLEEATSARLAAEQDAQAAREDLTRIQDLLDQRRTEQLRVDQQLAEAILERDSLNAELAQLASDQLQQQQDLIQVRQELAELQDEAAALAEEQAQTRQELDAARAERQRTTQELQRLEQQREAVSGQLATAQDNLAQILAQREQVAAELSHLEQTIGQLQQERSQAEASLAEVAQERERMAGEIREMERALERLHSQRAEAAPAQPPVSGATELARYEGEPRPAESRGDGTPRDGQENRQGTVMEPHDPVTVTDVRFEQVQGIDRITVEFSGQGAQVRSLPWSNGRAGLLIEGASLPESLHRTLDTRAFEGPVQFVSSFTDESGQVHLLAELTSAASEILSQEGRLTTWEFSQVALEDSDGSAWGSDLDGYNSQAEAAEPPPIHRPGGVSYTIGERTTGLRVPRLSRRLRVTIDLVNADIQNVLRLFSDQGDVNIIASGGVSGSITLRLRGVPLDQAFALILQSQGLGWEQHGNIIRVAPIEEFEEERRRELQRIAEAFDVEPLQVRLRPVSYASGQQMLGLLGDVLSGRGTASFDDRTHTLILTDVAENLDAAEQLIDALDRQTPQVLIEARIVQTGETFSRGFGIQWGGDALFSPANGNATGLLFPSTIGIAGGAGQTPADGTATTPNFAVNVPGPSAGALGFQFGSLGQAVNLNLRLSAAEAAGNAKVISAPRILTLDGQAASISTGLSIPVQTVGAAGANVTFIQANLSLTVTPTVTPDGFVHLNLNITKNEPDFGRTGANGDPSIITRTAQTQLLVRDGETSVIGGIFEHLSGTEQTGVPILSDIPILGVLFHDYSFQDERNETLVFITPRIVNREVSLANYAPGEVLMTPPE